MNTTKKSLATATIAATALAGLSFAFAPGATAATTATKTFTKSFPDSCSVGFFGQYNLQATVSGTVPTAVARNAKFNLTNAKIRVVLPGNLNAQAYAAGARFTKVTFKVVNLNNVKIVPATKDAVATDITTGFVAVPNGATSAFNAPTTGGLTVPLTAGTTTGTGKLNAGAVQATFTLYNAAKQPIISGQSVTCAAPKTATGAPITLTTINIT